MFLPVFFCLNGGARWQELLTLEMPLLRNLLERHKVPYSIEDDLSEEEERSVALRSFAASGWMKGSKERPRTAKDPEPGEKLWATEKVTDSEDPGSQKVAEKEVVKPDSEQKEEAKEEKEKDEKEKEEKEEKEKEEKEKEEKEKEENEEKEEQEKEKEENEKQKNESTEKADEKDQEEVDQGETPDTETGSQGATSSGARGKSDRLRGCFFRWPRKSRRLSGGWGNTCWIIIFGGDENSCFFDSYSHHPVKIASFRTLSDYET